MTMRDVQRTGSGAQGSLADDDGVARRGGRPATLALATIDTLTVSPSAVGTSWVGTWRIHGRVSTRRRVTPPPQRRWAPASSTAASRPSWNSTPRSHGARTKRRPRRTVVAARGWSQWRVLVVRIGALGGWSVRTGRSGGRTGQRGLPPAGNVRAAGAGARRAARPAHRSATGRRSTNRESNPYGDQFEQERTHGTGSARRTCRSTSCPSEGTQPTGGVTRFPAAPAARQSAHGRNVPRRGRISPVRP